METLIYQKEIYGCHHCPNTEATKNGKNSLEEIIYHVIIKDLKKVG